MSLTRACAATCHVQPSCSLGRHPDTGSCRVGFRVRVKVYLAACAICCQRKRAGVTAHDGLHLLAVGAEDCDVVLVVLALPAAGALHHARQACMVRLQSACAVRSGVNICNCLLTCSGQQ